MANVLVKGVYLKGDLIPSNPLLFFSLEAVMTEGAVVVGEAAPPAPLAPEPPSGLLHWPLAVEAAGILID